MLVRHVHDALAQVRELRAHLIERDRFTGYSGRVRMACGVVALVAATVLSRPWYPASPWAHLAGWGAVFLVAVLANGASIAHWFLHDPTVKRERRKLTPLLEVAPPLVVGGIVSAALISHGEFGLLFGIWMCMYGLANIATRHVVPRSIGLVGLFYVLCGAAALFWPNLVFANPWPMGIVFCGGEVIGGFILHVDSTRRV